MGKAETPLILLRTRKSHIKPYTSKSKTWKNQKIEIIETDICQKFPHQPAIRMDSYAPVHVGWPLFQKLSASLIYED